MEVNLIKDDSFWDSSPIVESYVQQDPTQQRLELTIVNDNITQSKEGFIFVEFNIYASSQKRVLQRRYQKITELISYLGGMASVLQVLGRIFAELALYVKFLSMFINKLYRIEENEKEESPHKIEKEHEKFHLNESSKSNFNVDKRNKKDIEVEFQTIGPKSDSLQKERRSIIIPNEQIDFKANDSFRLDIRNILSKKKNKFKITFFDYFKYYLKKTICRKKFSQKDKTIDKAEKIYRNNMEIYNIMEKIQEIGNLKIILLNQKQIQIFNLLKNPVLMDSENHVNENILEKEAEEAIQFYENQNNAPKFSDLDIRILELMQK